MAYVAPTVDEFLIRFPELSDTEDDVVQSLLDEAGRYVDTRWREADYKAAILYLSAHWASKDKSPEGGGVVASESFGPISISYARADGVTNVESTEYGRRFYDLLRGNHSGPIVI